MEEENLKDIPGSIPLWFGSLFIFLCIIIYCLIEIKGAESSDEITSITEVSASYGGSKGGKVEYLKLETIKGYTVSAPIDSDLKVGDKIEFIETHLIHSDYIRYKFVQKI